MAYNNLISRGDVTALMPENVVDRFLRGTADESAALAAFPTVRVPTSVTKMPVLSALPLAYFVSGDTGLKQTTEMAWGSVNMTVEELAAIVPVPESVLEDLDFDLWGAVMPRLQESIGRAIDAAIFFGTNKPASWPAAIVPAAVTAGNTYNRGTNAAAAGGLAEDLNQLLALVEADGYDPNFVAAARTYRARLRGVRATTGERLLDVNTNSLEGIPIRYALPGQWPTGSGAAEVIAGDRETGIIGLRRDFTFKLFTEGVVQDETGAVIYNLMQQDMVALRVTFRMAFQMVQTPSYEASGASRYPFAVLRAP